MSDSKTIRPKPDLYADILSKIVTREFPPGHRLTEEDLALTYHVSRTPIREVLLSLHKEGLVERSRNRGAKVVSFGPDDVEQIYEIRAALECLAVRKAAQRIRLSDLHMLEHRLLIANQCASENWQKEQADIDFELHAMIVSHSGNRRLAKYLENVSSLIHSLRLIGYRNDEYALAAGEDHLAIVRALMHRDASLAERLLVAHINSSMRHVLELFFSSKNAPEVFDRAFNMKAEILVYRKTVSDTS
jgi:DNA-binding GntR family transcriptional regulator